MIAGALEGIRVVELREWQTLEIPGASLDPSDRALVHGLTTEDRRLAIDELRTGLRIRATSWVGVIRLARIEIRIAPKLVGSPSWLVAMLDFAGGIENLQRLTVKHPIEDDGKNLLDLFIVLLCEASQDLWEYGLLADYVELVDDLPVMKGRLLVDRQVRERFGRLDRLICRFDERETDIVENQLLAAALTIASRRARSITLRHRAHRLASLFREQCTPEALDLGTARESLAYHRLNQHYKAGHGLAWLVLDGLGIRDLHAVGATDCFAFLLNMNSLFEAFVDRLVRSILQPVGAVVESQRKDASVLRNLTTSRSYASVIPDLVVTLDDVCVPMDAKYKTYDGEKADRGDLYQAFLYAMAYRRQREQSPRSLLLYPSSTDNVTVVRLAITNSRLGDAAEISLCAVPVARVLDQFLHRGPAMTRLRAMLLENFARPATTLQSTHHESDVYVDSVFRRL